jgi:farnesyl diphosphate synthase
MEKDQINHNEKILKRTQIIQQQLIPLPCSNIKQTAEEEKKEFIAIFNILCNELIRELPLFEIPLHAREWIKKLIQTNVPGGKMNRGLTVIDSFRKLVEHRELSRSEIFKAHVLGWCVEWLQAFFLVSDDIMDQSITRRGQICWYRMPHPLGTSPKEMIGNIAINDSFILESLIYRILRRYFSSENYYCDLLNLFHDISYRTELGQLLDLTSNLPGGKVDLSLFTLENYKLIVKYKTAYYSFYLPVAIAMLLTGITSQPTFQTAEDILLPMGEYFQIQDDFLDCYGDPKIIGKIGRDIEDNKCTWLIVQALRYASPQQKQLLEKHYGRDNENDVSVVKKIYNEIGIPKIFKQYEEESYESLCKLIKEVRSMPQEVFTDLLSKIYKRNM